MDLGENLIFIHGSGGNRKTWSNQIDYFSKNHNVFAIDLPGHGEQKGGGKSSVEDYVEYIKEFIEEKSIKNPWLIGHSLGGAIVLSFALKYKEIAKAIVLVGTGARLRVLPRILNAIKSNYEDALKPISDFGFSPKTDKSIVSEWIKETLKCPSEVTYGDFQACDKFDVMNDLNKIKIPTLIICGSEDQLTPIKYSQYLKENIKDSKLVIIEDAGHMVMFEKPNIFNQALDAFL